MLGRLGVEHAAPTADLPPPSQVANYSYFEELYPEQPDLRMSCQSPSMQLAARCPRREMRATAQAREGLLPGVHRLLVRSAFSKGAKAVKAR